MKQYTRSFKINAVKKAMSRDQYTKLNDVARGLNIPSSTLVTWVKKAKNNELEIDLTEGIENMSIEQRPQDWTLEERLNAVVATASLSPEELNSYCREKGIYSHHVDKWKLDFIKGKAQTEKAVSPSQIKDLKKENKILKRELNRKDKALAETAALLVLKKKAQFLWDTEEED